jgi:hypothetical protein
MQPTAGALYAMLLFSSNAKALETHDRTTTRHLP